MRFEDFYNFFLETQQIRPQMHHNLSESASR